MTDLAELRRLAENVLDEGLSTANRIMFARRYQERADAKTILSLLDELDQQERLLGQSSELLHETDSARFAAEQRVAALEEGLRRIVAWFDVRQPGLPVSSFGPGARVINEARQLLQASAQDASEGSGKP